jgi:cobalt-zinc-cadmium efflux system outer membrane protein
VHSTLLLYVSIAAEAQQPVTRQQAIDAAIARGPRVLVAFADTALARGQLGSARAWQNPTVTGEYTKSPPQRHLSVELPLDFPWLRAARVGAARLAVNASRYRFALERAGARFDADVAYTRALAAEAHVDISRRLALEADTLIRMTVIRRDAGDASELDVLLATVSGGQLMNDAQRDSVDAIGALLNLQVVMGLEVDRILITLADSLALPADTIVAAPGKTLAVLAAEADLAAGERTLALESRAFLPAPSLVAGFETGDPSGFEGGLLPIVGISIPLPLLNRNRGPIAVARANRDRAFAKLAIARRESAEQIARAERERSAALLRAARGRMLVLSANRITGMSRRAYLEGAAGFPAVLESQRNAREALGRYIDDLAAANLAAAALRLAAAVEVP